MIFKYLIRILRNKINKLLDKKNIILIYRKGSAIGDHLYMTSVLREIASKGYKIILFSNYFELFLNNIRIKKIYKMKKNIFFFLNLFKGRNILEFRSPYNNIENKHFLFFHKNSKIHLSKANSEHFNLDLKYEKLDNEFFFSKNELTKWNKSIHLPLKFSLIQSTTKKKFTSNKEWDINGMQGIVNHFKKINWIQIGKSDEPKLKNCTHLLNLNLRELAYVVYKSEFLVTYEGLFNHIASCFNKKNFLIHTGFLPIEAFNYKNNILIENNKDYPCYPCYDINCKDHLNLTKKNIKIEEVIKKIEDNII
jgi:ADP-heptose:LPS heptosyltransferase